MSCFAQEESRSISENVKWGVRKAFADGRYYVPYARFLGYEKGPDNTPMTINEGEALLVRYIYLLFLEGYSSGGIAQLLTSRGIKTPGAKEHWSVSTVESIVNNEKYRGDALLQKTYVEDFLTRKKRKNHGELPKYYVSNGHEAIIPRNTAALVQEEIATRKVLGRTFSGNMLFSQKIKCLCGCSYGHRISLRENNPKYSFHFWRCINYYKGGQHSKAIREDVLIYSAINKIIECYHEPAIVSSIEALVGSLSGKEKKAAEILWRIMESGGIRDFFYDERTWRFIIREITVADPYNPTINLIADPTVET